jgi:hypothetical protein
VHLHRHVADRDLIGDYNNLAVTSSGVVPVWTDRRFKNNDIFTVTGMK